MSTLTKLAHKITISSDHFFTLLKEEDLLKEAIVATIIFTVLLFILI